MKLRLIAGVFGFVFLTGCVPDLVSVSKDGTIALTLTKDGRFEPLDDWQQLYLTNAKADFLTAIEGMEKCQCPQIAPSGKAIVAQSKDGLVLYERSAKGRRVVYSPPKSAGDVSASFPVWSPDEKRIAFFVGDFGEDVPNCKLYIYDVKRKELEVVAHRASPRATWLPNGKRLFYVSFSAAAFEKGAPPFGDLKRINVETLKQVTVAAGQMLAYSKIALFPDGKAILFPCADWESLEISRGGLTVPLVLKKEAFSLPAKAPEKSGQPGAQPQEAGKQTEPKAKPDGQTAQPADTVDETTVEHSIVIGGDQSLSHYGCAVSPDGERIAFVRYFWEDRPTPASPDKEAAGGQPAQKKPAAGEAASAETKHSDPDGVEFCVAKADGTEVVVVARGTGEALFGQVIWLANNRLLCVTPAPRAKKQPVDSPGSESPRQKIIVVDADGSNPFDLTETIRTKFADQFQPEEKPAEEQPAKAKQPK